MLLFGIILSNDTLNGRKLMMIVLGGISAVVATIIKSHLEHTSGRKADACQKQLALLNRQQEQAIAERDELDKHIPDASGTLQSRLEQAEAELARLEELVPLESHRVHSHQESMSMRDRMNAHARRKPKFASRRGSSPNGSNALCRMRCASSAASNSTKPATRFSHGDA